MTAFPSHDLEEINNNLESTSPRSLCSWREENENYLKLLASLDIESASRNDVIEAFNKKFTKHAIAPLIANDFKSNQLSADRHFIDNNFEIYSDYVIKN